MTNPNKMIKVQLIRSLIHTRKSHRAAVRGLGLHRLNSMRNLLDTRETQGMINKVSYLVKVITE